MVQSWKNILMLFFILYCDVFGVFHYLNLQATSVHVFSPIHEFNSFSYRNSTMTGGLGGLWRKVPTLVSSRALPSWKACEACRAIQHNLNLLDCTPGAVLHKSLYCICPFIKHFLKLSIIYLFLLDQDSQYLSSSNTVQIHNKVIHCKSNSVLISCNRIFYT